MSEITNMPAGGLAGDPAGGPVPPPPPPPGPAGGSAGGPASGGLAGGLTGDPAGGLAMHADMPVLEDGMPFVLNAEADNAPLPPHAEMPFVLDAEAEAAIDVTLARIEASIKERMTAAQKSAPMQHVVTVLTEIEARADRILASIFGAK